MYDARGGDVIDLADEEDDAVLEEHLLERHLAIAVHAALRAGHGHRHVHRPAAGDHDAAPAWTLKTHRGLRLAGREVDEAGVDVRGVDFRHWRFLNSLLQGGGWYARCAGASTNGNPLDARQLRCSSRLTARVTVTRWNRPRLIRRIDLR